jgi:hypothetical protein
MAARVAILQPAHEERVDRGAGHHAELPAERDGASESPAGDADTHAALENGGERDAGH